MNATFNSNYIYGKQTTFIAPIKEAGMLKHVYNAPNLSDGWGKKILTFSPAWATLFVRLSQNKIL